MTTRVDLLAAERAGLDRWFAALYSPAVRRQMATPLTVIGIIAALYILQHVRVSFAETAAQHELAAYQQKQQLEAAADVQRANYNLLLSMVSEISLLQHSIVDRAQEVKDIVNVTRKHDLALLELSDLQALQGTPTWSLTGAVVDHSESNTCHDIIGRALPAFLKVKGVVSAIPQRGTRQSQTSQQGAGSSECRFDLRLGRSS